ncbi:MAG: Fis family transcriptional regulator [Verrucomicrobiales bacterium]|nr:Fis family transcriptional regulator [Verrucomicrobiales bacterium]
MKSATTKSHQGERILLVDDVPENLAVLSAALEPEGYEILTASDGFTALKVAEKALPSLILLDVMMPGMDGLEACRELKRRPKLQEVPVIFITARGDMDGVVEGFKAGGVDYIVKPFQTEEVLSRIETHLRIGRLTHELRIKNQELSAEIERRQRVETDLKVAGSKLETFSDLEASRGNIGGFVGNSPLVRRTIEEIRRLNQFSNTSVLILGESGTGKELVARAIHFGSSRARAPFVPVNCVAIPSELAESILFGHVKGAFTGATSDRKGCFGMADGGTLCLDEIGDMPVGLQVKLLRVLEDGLVTPVGASEPIKVDVRVIAATNADLDSRISKGSFREDLYFRLARYTIQTTPLRERTEDVPLLAAHFLGGFAAEMGRRPPGISAEAIRALKAYRFPGNIREMKNIMERAVIESDGGEIQLEHLSLTCSSRETPGTTIPPVAKEMPLNLEAAEDLLIQRAMEETHGNIAEAARLLGVHRTRIYRRLAQVETVKE